MMALVEIILAAVISTADIQAQQITDRAPECLALNMYHEARSQGTAGLFAVSAVVLNRVNDTRFPNSVCEVVEQGPDRESW
jgi:spore germination cell wall hydrolase CwlJ-like protein